MLAAIVIDGFQLWTPEVIVFGRIIFVINAYYIIVVVLTIGVKIALLHFEGASVSLLVCADPAV